MASSIASVLMERSLEPEAGAAGDSAAGESALQPGKWAETGPRASTYEDRSGMTPCAILSAGAKTHLTSTCRGRSTDQTIIAPIRPTCKTPR